MKRRECELGDYTEMGQIICIHRKRKGWTQKQLAEKLCLSDKTISKWECGAGYPDISILFELSKNLDISVADLFCGLQEQESRTEENIVLNTLRYSEEVVMKQKYSKKQLVFIAISVLFLTAIATCLIVNIALEKRVSWSMIPIISTLFAWLIMASAFVLKNKRIRGILISFSVCILPFLYVLDRATSHSWFFSMALPLGVLVLIGSWVVYGLTRTNMSRWIITAIAVLFVSPIDFLVDWLVDRDISMLLNPSNIAVLSGSIVVVVIFVIIGIKSKQNQSQI